MPFYLKTCIFIEGIIAWYIGTLHLAVLTDHFRHRSQFGYLQYHTFVTVSKF